MKVYIEPKRNFTEEIKYAWSVCALNKRLQFTLVSQKELADFIIDTSSNSDLPIAEWFYDALEKGIYRFEHILNEDCLIVTKQGKPDYLATAFYMINALQEYNSNELDEIGRFKFINSYQYKLANIKENLVQKYFTKIFETPKLNGHNYAPMPSSFFLSHDIDSINGALFQDGIVALKQGRFDIMLKLLFNAVSSNPDWLNMDKIMKIEDLYSFKSTFYWLVNRGRIDNRMQNSDYNYNSKPIQKIVKRISSNGWENGIHKSISTDSFNQELKKLKQVVIGNRYHYLRFNLPSGFDEIEKAGLKLDASLGFAEAYGFRNSYGLPFQPFNLKNRVLYKFVEVPLHIMDGTFQRYMMVPAKETAKQVISFMERHNEECVFSILWHNTFFTEYKYKGYLEEYKKILAYLYDKKFNCLTQQQIIDRYILSK